MIWQDSVITIVGIILSISLIPQVHHGFKEKTGPIKYQTSVPTFIGLYIISFAYITLSLYLSAASIFLTGTLWLILFIQRLIYEKK